jgi:hypothetical protein
MPASFCDADVVYCVLPQLQAATCGDANGATADDADYACPTGYRYKGASVDSTVIEFLTPENAKRDACCEVVSINSHLTLIMQHCFTS